MFKFQSFFFPRRWNTWLTSEGVETPLHLLEEFCTFQCVISLEGHSAAFKVEPLFHHEHWDHIPRGEKEIVAWFCCFVVDHFRRKEALLFQSLLFRALSSLCFPRKNSFKMPTICQWERHKGLPWFQWCSFNRKEGLSTQLFYILAFTLKNLRWRKSLEEGSETESATS